VQSLGRNNICDVAGGGVLKITFLAEKMMDHDDKPPVFCDV